MGQSKANKERQSQQFNILMTMQERLEQRALLLNGVVKDADAVERVPLAIEALAHGVDFDQPADDAERQAWVDDMNSRLAVSEWVPLNYDNVTMMLRAFEARLQAGKVEGAEAFRTRHIRRRLQAAKDNKEVDGEVQFVELQTPDADKPALRALPSEPAS